MSGNDGSQSDGDDAQLDEGLGDGSDEGAEEGGDEGLGDGGDVQTDTTGTLFTSLSATGDQPAKITCQVGTEKANSHTDLIVDINGVELERSLVSDDVASSSDYRYSFGRDQISRFEYVSNDKETLPHVEITKLTWMVKKGASNLTPKEETEEIDGVTYDVYEVRDDTVNQYLLGEVLIQDAGDDGSTSAISRHIIVRTEPITQSSATGVTITLSGSGMTSTDNAGNTFSTKTITLVFNAANQAFVGSVNLDFERAGLVAGVDYSVKTETIESEERDVYYFEADGGNLDLAASTFSDALGVRSFEASKDNSFANGQSYSITYELKNLDAFGSNEANEYFNNNDLDPGDFLDDGTLADNSSFKKTGIGYKLLVVQCKKGTSAIGENKEYVIRFVSPAEDLGTRYRVSKNVDYWYGIETGEVVHVRRGEAVTPGFYVKGDDGNWKALDAISDQNPYINYTIETALEGDTADPETIAQAKVIGDEGTYRVSGLNSGVVTVVATGAVNKSLNRAFTLYVNKDVFTGEFELGFGTAVSTRKMSSYGIVEGRQDAVPVDVNPLVDSMGIPVLKWSLPGCDPAVATIDADTGVISTYASTGSSGSITVHAESGDGKYKDEKTFTIHEVDAEGVLTLSEKVGEDATAKVVPNGDNLGTCKVGDTFTLAAATYVPANATRLSGNIEWSSSDESKATVDETGVVNALAETGTSPVTITATYHVDGVSSTTTYGLTISGYANPLTSISAENLTLEKGASATLKITCTPEDATNRKVTFESSDTDVANVSGAGVVTAVGYGESTITITSVADPTVKTTVTVTVPNAVVLPTAVSVADLSVEIGKSAQLTVKVNPADATDSSVTYTSSNPAIAEVAQDGTVTAKKVGSCEVTVTSVSAPSVKGTATVTVTAPVVPVETITVSTLALEVGKSEKLGVTVAPENATDKSVTYKSSDEKVATVAADGTVTAVAPGECDITVASVSNPAVTTKVKVTVGETKAPDTKIPVTNIILSSDALSIGVGKTAAISATVLPVNASDLTVSYTSSNSSIATVAPTGVVTGHSVGNCSVIVTSVSNPEVFSVVAVTVTAASTIFTPSEPSVNKAQSQNISLKVAKKTYKFKAVSKKAVKFTIGAKAKTSIKYKPTNAKSKKAIKVTKKGKVTVKKGTKRGTYSITLTAVATSAYKSATRVVKVIVK